MAIEAITADKNSINKFLIAKYVFSKPKRFAKRIGINIINPIPKINESIADSLESLFVLNPDNPNLLAYHPVTDTRRHIIKVIRAAMLIFSTKIIIRPTIDIREKMINVNHEHTLTNIPCID